MSLGKRSVVVSIVFYFVPAALGAPVCSSGNGPEINLDKSLKAFFDAENTASRIRAQKYIRANYRNIVEGLLFDDEASQYLLGLYEYLQMSPSEAAGLKSYTLCLLQYEYSIPDFARLIVAYKGEVYPNLQVIDTSLP